MGAEPREDPQPEAGPAHQGQAQLRAASLSALEETLRQALDLASREEVLLRVAAALPAPSAASPPPGLHGKVQKVSVSMPTELTQAVRSRTGAGGFSRYVADAVQERFKHDLLGDLLNELEAEHGPVPEEIRAQTRLLWPDETP